MSTMTPSKCELNIPIMARGVPLRILSLINANKHVYILPVEICLVGIFKKKAVQGLKMTSMAKLLTF